VYDPHLFGFALGHPAFFRQLMFTRWDVECFKGIRPQTMGSPGYGRSVELTSLPPEIDENVLTLSGNMFNQLHSDEAAIAAVTRELETLNILEKEKENIL
jgi:hypothetical protein